MCWNAKFFCDDRDCPWINKKIENASHDKNTAFKLYRIEKTISPFKAFQSLQRHLTDLINKAKETFDSRLSKKLMNPCLSQKNTGQY